MRALTKYNLLTAIGAFFLAGTAHAQLNPAGASYFMNQYLANPAYAGSQKGLQLNGGLRKLWSGIPGSPEQQYLTVDYGAAGKRVGVGLLLASEKTGVIRSTRMLASYAYHLPVGAAGQQLNFGISLGLQNQDIDISQIEGDADDVQAVRYNDQKTYMDGDFGVSYISDNLSLQASMPNLKSIFNKDFYEGADRNTFMAAASYKWRSSGDAQLPAAWSLEPKVVFRAVKGYEDIVDAGAQLNFAGELLNVVYMYHTSQSSSFGIGMNYKRRYQIQGMYTTNTAAIRNYVNGSFEVGVRAALFD
jgi:type IX secretion system PorP/SprF family membrane protein